MNAVLWTVIYTKDGVVVYATVNGHVVLAKVPATELPKLPGESTTIEEFGHERVFEVVWEDGWIETTSIINAP